MFISEDFTHTRHKQTSYSLWTVELVCYPTRAGLGVLYIILTSKDSADITQKETCSSHSTGSCRRWRSMKQSCQSSHIQVKKTLHCRCSRHSQSLLLETTFLTMQITSTYVHQLHQLVKKQACGLASRKGSEVVLKCCSRRWYCCVLQARWVLNVRCRMLYLPHGAPHNA